MQGAFDADDLHDAKIDMKICEMRLIKALDRIAGYNGANRTFCIKTGHINTISKLRNTPVIHFARVVTNAIF